VHCHADRDGPYRAGSRRTALFTAAEEGCHFDEYGCTFCHKVGAGKVAMTDLGTKLPKLHLGCVDIEKTLASKR
jgi:hypothetical protein